MARLMDGWTALLLIFFTPACLGFQGTFRPSRAVGQRSFVRFTPSLASPTITRTSQLYFFGRKNKKEEAADTESEKDSAPAETATSTKMEEPPPPVQPEPVVQKVPEKELSPQEKAAKLRADAERARLEAQRMDAELTLRKIEALEKKIKKKKDKPDDDNDGAKLQDEISRLSQKFKEQTTEPVAKDQSDGEASSTETTSSSTTSSSFKVWATDGVVWPRFINTSQDEATAKENKEELQAAIRFIPNFLKVLIVTDMAEKVEFNETAVDEGDKLIQACQRFILGDLNMLKIKEPRFSQTELDKAVKRVGVLKDTAINEEMTTDLVGMLASATSDREENSPDDVDQDEIVMALWSFAVKRHPDASTEDLARLLLEYEFYLKNIIENAFEDDFSPESAERVLKAASEEWFLKPLFRNQGDGNTTFVSFLDNVMDSLFPKSTTQLKNDNPVLPPKGKVDLLASEILPQTLFRATSRPQPVLGGFVIKGSSIPEKDEVYGDKVIQSINDKLAERKYAAVAESMTVSYLPDFVYLEEAEGEMFFTDDEIHPPLLYICGPNIARSSRPIQLSIVSAIGLATTWYLSLYPFLLNRGIASRVDEELAMIDAGVMAPDLSWLTELSLPLFVTFASIQVLHEVAHSVVAKANGIKTFPPTLVPSILTGITSSVTSLKTPPKNLNAMFDFAIVGPLTGMVASTFALVWGSQLTGMVDSANFPALPLEILRQSTLGGGIINNVIGEGVLNVPVSALGSPAIAEMTVALHPLAVAGYIGLILNALSLLPIGTTDGGRVALAVFGRQGKSGIGTFALAVLLWFGVAGSDLLLYYFSFCIAFQSGNEIPAQNEVDKVSLPRVFLAVVAYVVAALALIPFQ